MAEHQANYSVYGARKMWKHLHRAGHPVARCTVERLMRAADLHGAARGRAKRTTIPAKDGHRATDLVNRAFTATAPNQLWVADFTYVRTWAGFSYVAFVIDVFSRMIVGWKADTTMRATLVTDTLEMAVWSRGRTGVSDLTGLIHHSDAGSQYVSFALTERLAAARNAGLDRDRRRRLRQRSRRVDHRAVQDRAHPPARPMADLGRRRDRDPRMGRLVQQPAPAHRARRHPTRRARGPSTTVRTRPSATAEATQPSLH